MDAKRRLGKGLSALIPELSEEKKIGEIIEIDIEKISPNPHQARIKFDEEKIEEIKKSIQAQGLIQPIIVRKQAEGSYQLVAGERRLRAVKSLGWKKIQAIVLKIDKESQLLEKSLIENIQRQDLNPIEEAKAYKKLKEAFGYTLEEIASLIGKDKVTISNIIRLLQLPGNIQEKILEGQISAGHARALLALDDPRKQREMVHLIEERRLSVRDAEKLIYKKKKEYAKMIDPNIIAMIEEIQRKLGVRVKLQARQKGGILSITYTDIKDLERIIEHLLK